MKTEEGDIGNLQAGDGVFTHLFSMDVWGGGLFLSHTVFLTIANGCDLSSTGM